MAFNGGLLNHLLTPYRQYTPLLSIVWDEKPFTAMHIFVSKSLIAFTHFDARSQLNLWTYELDSITSIVYLLSAAIAALGLKLWANPPTTRSPWVLPLLFCGTAMLAFSVSYMTAIDHCSGPTWVGFVTLYGLGMEESSIYLWWQIAFAVIGISLLITALLLTQKNKTAIHPG
jgi:hypothetical protein